MIGLIDRLLGRPAPQGSKEEAKSRLKVLLVHDQVDLSTVQMEAMKQEILDVIARYADIDREHVELRLERHNNQPTLVSSIPVRRVTGRASA